MQNSAPLEFPQQSRKSGHEVVVDLATPASTHGSLARLRRRLQRNTRKYYGDRPVEQYLIQLQCRKRREWFELGPDLEAAVKKARDLDHYLGLHGWEETRQKFKPEFAAELSELTVGGYLEILRQHGQIQQSTLFGYACVFRRIVASIAGINLGGRDKYDGRSNRSNWRLAVEKVHLNTIRPEGVSKWRDAYYVSSKIEPTTFFTPEPPKAVDAAPVFELLKRTLEQSGIRMPVEALDPVERRPATRAVAVGDA
ncbi:MAG: hypothetical protein ABI222_17855 [Opitutaceae bacterium]